MVLTIFVAVFVAVVLANFLNSDTEWWEILAVFGVIAVAILACWMGWAVLLIPAAIIVLYAVIVIGGIVFRALLWLARAIGGLLDDVNRVGRAAVRGEITLKRKGNL
jgi:uncharacterized membrane protein